MVRVVQASALPGGLRQVLTKDFESFQNKVTSHLAVHIRKRLVEGIDVRTREDLTRRKGEDGRAEIPGVSKGKKESEHSQTTQQIIVTSGKKQSRGGR